MIRSNRNRIATTALAGVGSALDVLPEFSPIPPTDFPNAIDATSLKSDRNAIADDLKKAIHKQWLETSKSRQFQLTALPHEASYPTRTAIAVVGVGSAGGAVLDHLIAHDIGKVEFVSVNTDAHALSRSLAAKRIQIGSNGLGAGNKLELGRDAAELSVNEIRKAIGSAQMVFIVAGMGGGTGSGAAPVIARVAKEAGALTVAVVSRPFDWEGQRHRINASIGLAELETQVDTMFVIDNERLLEKMGDDITFDQAISYSNSGFIEAVGGLAHLLNNYTYVNIDFEDVRTVLREPGYAAIGFGTAEGPDRARIAAKQAVTLSSPTDVLTDAKGILILLSAAKNSLKLSESKLFMKTIREIASPDAHVIYGASFDETLGDQIKVTVLAA